MGDGGGRDARLAVDCRRHGLWFGTPAGDQRRSRRSAVTFHARESQGRAIAGTLEDQPRQGRVAS